MEIVLIAAKALVNVRPELDKDGNPAGIVRAGETAMLQVHELERYVNLGSVEAPPYKYEPEAETEVEETKRGPGRPKKEGSDA